MTRVFIGSSSKGLRHAEYLRKYIEEYAYDGADVKCDLWNDSNMFKLSYSTVEGLLRIKEDLKNNKGFAVLLFTPDDMVFFDEGDKKSSKYYARRGVVSPRDNVVFELGLFLGGLNRDNVFCVYPENYDLRILSDWKGNTNARYQYNLTHIEEPMKIPAKTIVREIGLDKETYLERLFS